MHKYITPEGAAICCTAIRTKKKWKLDKHFDIKTIKTEDNSHLTSGSTTLAFTHAASDNVAPPSNSLTANYRNNRPKRKHLDGVVHQPGSTPKFRLLNDGGRYSQDDHVQRPERNVSSVGAVLTVKVSFSAMCYV